MVSSPRALAQALDEHETRSIGPYQDRRHQALIENACGNLVSALLVEGGADCFPKLPPCNGRHERYPIHGIAHALLLAAPSRIVRLATIRRRPPTTDRSRRLVPTEEDSAGNCVKHAFTRRIRRGRHWQLPQIPGTLQMERSLAPTRRPFVRSCTAALLIADYEEMGFLEPAPRPRLPVALVADASRSSV
jgi:hypothetical protein